MGMPILTEKPKRMSTLYEDCFQRETEIYNACKAQRDADQEILEAADKRHRKKVEEIFKVMEKNAVTLTCRCGCWEALKQKYLGVNDEFSRTGK